MYYPLQEVVKGMIYSKVCSVLVYNVGRQIRGKTILMFRHTVMPIHLRGKTKLQKDKFMCPGQKSTSTWKDKIVER